LKKFAIKMAKMTQIGQKLAKITFLALSNFSPHRFAIFSFLTILWLKITQKKFWPRRWSKLKKLRFLAIKRDFLSKNTIFAIKMAKNDPNRPK
jgi:hypothetical protein